MPFAFWRLDGVCRQQPPRATAPHEEPAPQTSAPTPRPPSKCRQTAFRFPHRESCSTVSVGSASLPAVPSAIGIAWNLSEVQESPRIQP